MFFLFGLCFSFNLKQLYFILNKNSEQQNIFFCKTIQPVRGIHLAKQIYLTKHIMHSFNILFFSFEYWFTILFSVYGFLSAGLENCSRILVPICQFITLVSEYWFLSASLQSWFPNTGSNLLVYNTGSRILVSICQFTTLVSEYWILSVSLQSWFPNTGSYLLVYNPGFRIRVPICQFTILVSEYWFLSASLQSWFPNTGSYLLVYNHAFRILVPIWQFT